jgi:SAM-dependent methyltransferase
MNVVIHRILERRARRLAERVMPFLPEQGTVLDVGSGTGHNVRALQDRTALHFLEADVVNMSMVGPGPMLFDGRTLPFADSSIDCALMLFILHYSERPEELLREVGRVCRRVILLQSICRGRLGLLLLRAREPFQGRLAFRLARLLKAVPNVPCPLRPRRYFTSVELDRVIERTGFAAIYRSPRRRPWYPLRRDLYVLERAGP